MQTEGKFVNIYQQLHFHKKGERELDKKKSECV